MVSDRRPKHQNSFVRPQNQNSFSNFVVDLDVQPVQAECPSGGEQMEQDPSGTGVSGEPEQETHEEFGTRVRPGPSEPSPMDRDHHEATGHSVFRNWCDACVEGRGQASPHPSRSANSGKYAIPQVVLDYWFMGGQGEAGKEDLPVIVMYEKTMEALFGHRAKKKGSDMAVVQQICNDLDGLGIKRATYKSDQEPALASLMAAIKVHWKGELVPELAPRGDKNSNGAAENAVKVHEGLTRTLKIALEKRIGRHVPDDAVVMEWLVE